MRSRSVALSAAITALYAALVVGLAPISFHVTQVRVADALLPLSIILGPPAILGLTLGNLVANLVATPFGPVDVLGGTAANFIASYTAWRVGRLGFKGSWLLATLVETTVVSLVVGGYLSVLTGLPPWLTVGSLALGSFVAINLLGYTLLKALATRLKKSSKPAYTLKKTL